MRTIRLIFVFCLLCLLVGCVSDRKLPPQGEAARTVKVYIPNVTINNKKGIGLTYGNCSDVSVFRARWLYDWSHTPPVCDKYVDSVPMIWGKYIPSSVGGNSRWVLGFNEPDLPGQSNITPAEGAVLWREIEDRFSNYWLVAPAPSHLHPDWIVEWRNAYIDMYNQPPRVNALSAHCYLMSCRKCVDLVRWFIDRATEWDIGGGVWITEFAFLPCDASGSEARCFADWINSTKAVTRWAPFAARVRGGEVWWPDVTPQNNPSLVTASGNLTRCGELYEKP